MKNQRNKGITLIALIITIIIILVLAGIVIATLGGNNGLLAKTKQAKKAHIQSEMQEQLTLALNELQLDKKGSASLDDVTQDWINTVISSDYSPTIKEDASLDGKMVVMNKNDITGRFIVNQKLEISKTEFDISTLEFEYETEKIENGKVKILIKITDKVNGLKRVDFPEASKDSIIMENRKIPLGIDYYVELGKEYKFVITTGDGNKTEKTIKIDDYYYKITKTLEDGTTIDNNATKAAYNKTYEATITTEGNYAITSLIVTMGGQAVTTSENNIVDITTGKIKIEKVTGDIDIKVTAKELKIQYTAIAIGTSNSSNNIKSVDDESQIKGTSLYINIIANIEGTACTVKLKEDSTKTVPYKIEDNGKYTFVVIGTYNGKTISEEKEVIVNKYQITFLNTTGFGTGGVSGWTTSGSGMSGGLYGGANNRNCYSESNEAFDLTDINELKFSCGSSINKYGRDWGYAKIQLFASEDRTLILESETTAVTGGTILIKLDTSNIKGSYYIRIHLTCGGSSSDYCSVGLCGTAKMTGR